MSFSEEIWGDDPEREPPEEPTPDPEDDPTKRGAVAARDAKVLTLIAVAVSLILVSLCAALAAVGVPGMASFTPGLAVGCAIATLNLHILSRMVWGMFEQRVGPALLGFIISFGLLLGTALFLSMRHADWLLGFGVGLALPGAAGVVFAIWLNRKG